MRQRKEIEIIDTHTEGEPTRILIRDKLPEGCSSALEAREDFRRNEEMLRTAILLEPRGHRDQFGAVVYPSRDKTSDFTIFFTTTSGYLDMCAHATIGTTTALVYKGLIDSSDGIRKVVYDTPAGKVGVRVNIVNGEAESVTLENVPSFHLGRKEIAVDDPVGAKISVDIAYGGNFYAIVDSEDLGLKVDQEQIGELRAAGSAISHAVYEKIKPRHPLNSSISSMPLTMITGDPEMSTENYRNVVIFPNGSFDRSPCGTGTSARSSLLLKRGDLDVGESFTHESISDTTFKCTIKEETKVGNYDAVIPEVTGRAWVTQISKIIIDEGDPLKDGFLIG